MRKKEEKFIVEDTVSDIYNKLILKLDEYDELPNIRKKDLLYKVTPIPPLEDYKKIAYVTTMPTVESNQRKKIKNLDSKLLTRLPVLLAQIKAGYNSCKLKNEIRQILYFCINTIQIRFSEAICENLVELFQQLGGMGEDCKLPHREFVFKMLSQYKKIVYSLTLF